ncbi:hypothetical protein CXB51_026600 [Gossypium anomalum]|uniref:Serine/threonine-protein phosphatase 5 n=2 Tax=Gossypium TaxID=3633 RepID=A0A8J6CVN8_9ROSI|nr:hypothetical protein CXB51_026600 [Gossypium anomalum]
MDVSYYIDALVSEDANIVVLLICCLFNVVVDDAEVMPGMENEGSNLSRAEEIKNQANEAFKGTNSNACMRIMIVMFAISLCSIVLKLSIFFYSAHKYGQAIDLYTQAIELNSQNAVYWANRSLAHTKLEEYGSAIQDATKAIEGYYRRGAAYLAMGKFKEALKDFQQVKRICPNDPDATKKLKECEKAVMKLKFEEAISVPESERRSVADSIDYRTIKMVFHINMIFIRGRKLVMGELSCDDIKLYMISYFFFNDKSFLCVEELAILLINIYINILHHDRDRSHFTFHARPASVAFVAVLVTNVGGSSCHKCGSSSASSSRDMVVEPQYLGAKIEGDVVTLDFVKKMMDDFKNQKCLHKRYAFQIVLQMREMLQALPSLVDINVPDGSLLTVCGDVHGQFYDLINIFELNGLPSEENPYLFNGDFVDRGSFSVEVILTLFAFKCMCPSAIYLARGNHESKSMNKIYGFEGEVRSKLSETFVELFAEVFCYLPLAHVINQKVFVVHGGLFSVDGVKLSDIRAIDRFCEPPEEGLMCELLWSDPQPYPGRGPSKRGVGLSFGADVTRRFLQDNNLDLVVRSHEVKDEGYEIEHDGKLITVFSAPNYCDQMGNKGAFIRFEAPDLKPNIVTFSAVGAAGKVNFRLGVLI